MKELISIGKNQIGAETIQTVNARDLHQFLEAKRDFSDWIKSRIKRYSFTQDVDFIIFPQTREYLDGWSGKPMIDYHLSLEMAKELAMVERNEKGREARHYFLECERIALKRVQFPDFTNPIIAARAWADEVEQKQILQVKIEEQAPKVEFANQVEESINAIPIGNFAKYLHKHGLSIGQKRLFAFLRDRNILMGDNTPYQAHLNRGWFEVKELIISTAKGIFSRPKTLVTGKGQIALTNIVLAYYKNGNQKATYLPGLEVRA